jgi:CDGSH-type Zn-finger protein
MNKPTVAALQPIRVDLKAGKTYFFCTCGRSAKQPFCDGSHEGTTFEPKPFVAEKDGNAFLCQCKQTSNPPFCDGSHSKIPADQVGKEFSLEEMGS